ncbi:hypothetical protein P9272_18315 [Mesorhizobium sp. WSM4976]|uniref:hypothetical protein n=1 Tax=Mesorhizobium sp. WSM4976 TaxID=3038549 RepID=UPI0024159A69|nr:hypothetical protein [Mesorhizobium sp. WSM4976]MDG4895527.1 hypothetical protein [Mesorhizobium sp. WSM4976]
MKERFEVEATENGYRVLDPAGKVVATVERRPQAFEFVRDRGGRVHLQWARTVIGKQSYPRDFSAMHTGFGAGRIMTVISGDQRGRWAWFVNGRDPDTGRTGGFSGREDTKEQAVAQLEVSYTEFIANADRYGADKRHG